MTVAPGPLAIALPGSIAATLGLAGMLKSQGKPLEEAGFGIAALELAWSPGRSERILDVYRAKRFIPVVVEGLRLDSTLFIPSYATALILGCLVGAGACRGWGWPIAARIGGRLAWGMALAAALDYGENIGLYFQATRGTTVATWLLTFACSASKWALAAVGSLHGVVGLGVWAILLAIRGRAGVA